MAPSLRQSAVNSVKKRGAGDQGSVSLKTTLDSATIAGSLVIAVAFVTGGVQMPVSLSGASGFTQTVNTALRDTQLVIWRRENSAPVTSLTVSIDAYRGTTLRIYELTGIAQSSALDKIVINSGENSSPNSGSTSTLGAAGELVFGIVANQYTTSQSGYSGGLARIFETEIPDTTREDWERGRVTTHMAVASDTSARRLTASLSTTRRWISVILTFKSGTAGPARFTSTRRNAISVNRNKANLTVFGPLKVSLAANRSALSGVEPVKARIGPFDYQYRLNGWSGLLVGAGTAYPVESVEGLEGFSMRTSDDDIPRGDGSFRGVDLQTARNVLFRLSSGSTSANRAQVEARLAALFTALTPERDSDVELIFRHPGRPLRTIYYRPTDLVRELNTIQALVAKQAISLRAVDPRIYSAVSRTVSVPIAIDDSETVNVVAATNVGNARAYPVIRVTGPTSGADVTRVALFNASTDVSFEVDAVIQAKAELIGDMHTWVVGGGSSVISLNGQGKYGSWQLPREPFYIAPDPEAAQGVNLLYARTVPVGAPVTVTIEYRDTWSS